MPEKRVFAILATTCALALAAALVMNWIFAPQVVGAGTAREDAIAARAYSAGAIPNLPKPPKTMLATQIIGYEAITVQAVPGKAQTAAQAVYTTYNMNVDDMVQIGVYAQVEGFSTPSGARARVAEIMKQYPLEAQDVMLNNVTPGKLGYSPTRGAVVWAWVTGQYAVMVKSQYRDGVVPANPKSRPLLRQQGEPIALTTDWFQRTGQQGSGANAAIYKGKPAVIGGPDTTPAKK